MKKRTFGTYDIARLCQVTPPTVGRWIEDGRIPSFTTAGGHRRVWDTDLVTFLRTLNLPVPTELGPVAVLRILIVDDEAEVRRFVRRVVSKKFAGAEIHEAEDGFSAGHKVATLSPALVVLDVQLPGVNGINVCESIRADKNLRGVKILAISGYGVEETRKAILDAGADDFLAKPFTSDDLTERLAKLLPVSPQGSVVSRY